VKQSFEQRAKRLGLITTAAGPAVIESEREREYSKLFAGKPFWIWDSKAHAREWDRSEGQCCYNHLIKLPKKNDEPRALYAAQKRVIDSLEANRLLAVVKPRSSGITELMIRYMGYLCLRDNKLRGSNMVVISAPAEQLSISFIRRLKAHHEPYLQFDTKQQVCILNGVRIEAFPSHNLRRLRGITDVTFILAEESDFWNVSEESELLDTILPIVQKSTPYMALISTPGRLGGLMHRIHMAPDRSIGGFKKVYIKWQEVDLFSKQDVAHFKTQPDWAREFDLQWGFGMGNVFNAADIQKAVDLGKAYADSRFNPDSVKRPYPSTIYPDADTVIGVDPGAAGSLFAIVGMQIWGQHAHVFYASQFSRPDEDEMVDIIMRLWHGTHREANIFVDAANQAFIRKLKSRLKPYNENVDLEWQLEYLRKHGWAGKDDENLSQHMIVVPVSFGKQGPLLLQKAATAIQRNWVAIHPKFTELIEQLQSARTKENAMSDWTLDKSGGSLTYDLLDAYRLCHAKIIV
jgi:hypothetical protein